MNRIEACRILGVPGNCDATQVKKRYRQLLHLVHPDAAAFRQEDEEYPYGIHEIKAAYALLTGREEADEESDPVSAAHKGRYADKYDEDAWMRRDPDYAKAVWDAEENPEAFCQREILQSIEDFDGNVLGAFTLTRGKFLWKPEEEFHLFLQSISRATAKQILEIEEETERQIYGSDQDPWSFRSYASSESQREVLKLILREKLTYLLAQQFIDAANTLDQLVKTQKNKDGTETIYYIPAMLERGLSQLQTTPGETLLPEKVDQHRLYLKNQAGDSVGYLSFPDDRMYYLVVPLFEQKRVQVKIRVYESKEGETGSGFGKRKSTHTRLKLWLRFKESAGGMPEEINSQIRVLLEEYRNDLLRCFTA